MLDLIKQGKSIINSILGRKKKGPDYIIIGVQKGGTTTLYYQLTQHPQIDNPDVKEIHYFDVNYDKPITTYTSWFKDKSSKMVTGEATPCYLFHPHVAARIKKHYPKAKFIVLFRNPLERAYSHYQMTKRKVRYLMGTFVEELQKEESRMEDLHKRVVADESVYNDEVRAFSCIARGDYVTQVKNWLNYFDRSQFLFLESEEYYDNPQAELKRVYSFLNIDCVYPKDFSKRNVGEYPPLDEATFKKYNDYFKELNKELPELTGRNYSWL